TRDLHYDCAGQLSFRIVRVYRNRACADVPRACGRFGVAALRKHNICPRQISVVPHVVGRQRRCLSERRCRILEPIARDISQSVATLLTVVAPAAKNATSIARAAQTEGLKPARMVSVPATSAIAINVTRPTIPLVAAIWANHPCALDTGSC